jgi:hypothetical protein
VIFVSPLLLTHCRCTALLKSMSHARSIGCRQICKHTLGRTSLDKGSASRKILYLHNTQRSQEKDIHISGGIRTCNPSKRASAFPRRRKRGHWDRIGILPAVNYTFSHIKYAIESTQNFSGNAIY